MTKSHPTSSTESKSKPTASLRAAETSDVPRIARVIIDAMELSPHWTWRHAYRKQFPDVHTRETEKRIADYVRKSKDGICVALVAEVEVEKEVEVEEDGAKPTAEALLMGIAPGENLVKRKKGMVKEVVGVAIAQLPGTFVEPMTRVVKPAAAVEGDGKAPAAKTRQPPPPRADVHEARSRAFGAELGPAKKRYFDEAWGNHQLYIDFMAVDPAYHRRGIAHQLMNWMLDLAKREPDAHAVTLFASPLGEKLYLNSGFEQVGLVVVKLEGDTGEQAEGIEAPVMIWNREKHVGK